MNELSFFFLQFSRCRAKIDALLFSKGYKIVNTMDLGQDTWDVLYYRTPKADLAHYDRLLKEGWPSWFVQSPQASN
jgi:hypothetical protein